MVPPRSQKKSIETESLNKCAQNATVKMTNGLAPTTGAGMDVRRLILRKDGSILLLNRLKMDEEVESTINRAPADSSPRQTSVS